jgi:N-acylmannosamine kinase
MIGVLDIGGTKLSAGLYQDGDRVERRAADTPNSDPDMLIDVAASLFAGWNCSAVGVATTGYVAEGKVHSINMNTLSGWHGFPLEDALRARLGFSGTMLILNDAAAAAWAEFKARSPGSGRLAFATVSTGVGGGLVLDGELVQSPGGIAGHLGHVRIADSGSCGCGRVGCVEAVASGTAIARMAGERLGRGISTREVFERAAGDGVCRDAIDISAKAIAELSGNLRMLLETDLFVIGGGVGLAAGYIDRVRRHAAQLPTVARSDIQPAIHGEDAGLMGAYLRVSALLSTVN